MTATIRRELLVFAAIGLLFFAATGFDAFNAEHPYQGENPDQLKPGRLSLAERLGFAMIANAGYGSIELEPPSDANMHTPRFLVATELKPELDCIAGDRLDEATRSAPEGSGLKMLDEVDTRQAMMAAILAAEKYNRGPIRRGSEALIARGMLRFTGRVPEMSLGLAQVKPSIARQVLPKEQIGLMSEPEFLDFLLDDCGSAYVASLYVATLLHEEPVDRPVGDVVADVAARYNGGGNPDYAAAVAAAFFQMMGPNFDLERAAPSAAPNAMRLCAVFDTGLPEGRILVAGKEAARPVDDAARTALAAAQSVTLSTSQWEPGPKSLTDRLIKLRLDWTRRALHDLDLPADLPLVPDRADAAKICAVAADNRPRPAVSLITVTVRPGTALPPEPAPPPSGDAATSGDSGSGDAGSQE